MIKENRVDAYILIVDTDKHFTQNLFLELQVYVESVSCSTPDKFNLKLLDKYPNNKVIVLNIDNSDCKTIFDQLQNNLNIKTILVSEEENRDRRDIYFQNGILDFYSKSKKVKYIAQGINETLKLIAINPFENILIIHKDKKISNIMKKTLLVKNYNVLVANSGEEALAILRNTEVSLLVLDMQLEDINGLDFLYGLKELFLLESLIVLAVSSLEEPSLRRDALKIGASNFLQLPFLYEEFILCVDVLVQSFREKRTIIEQKQQIEQNLQNFKELVDATVGAMLVFKDKECINCNSEALVLLGYEDKKELLSKNLKDIFSYVAIEHKEYLYDDTIEYQFEDQLTNKNGKQFDISIKERNVLIDGNIIKIITVLDITQLKQNEKIVAQKSKLASMGEMIGNIAHQWRQPLTAISIAASGIKLMYECDIEERDETLASLDNIVTNSKFLSSTIEDFQNFIKDDRENSTFFIEDLIQSTLKLIDANITVENIRIVQNYQENLKITTIQNDLVQILLNIINNAVDAFKNKLKGDKLILIDISKENNIAYISLTDSAGGIDSNILDKVFEPYFTTKHQSQGTGLGLYMTHQIIAKLDGQIDVKNESFSYENKEYRGAKFTLSLPIF